MRLTTGSVTFTALLLTLGASSAKASTTLNVVTEYGRAEQADLWRKTSSGEIPASLVHTVTMPSPSQAFQAPNMSVFFQNERFVLCMVECDQPQPQPIRDAQGNFSFPNANARGVSRIDPSVLLKASNVYYWVNQLFDHMQSIGFVPTKRLLVRIDRDVDDQQSGAPLDNNAFFVSDNWSLSFLPVNNTFLFRKLSGFTFVSPAYDPVVAMHETTHSVFQQLIGSILNPEIYGLHEAFADYFALDIANDNRVGLIMGSGTPLRRNDQVLKYQPNLEVHALGNVVCSALWKIRALLADNRLSATLALHTVMELGKNPYIDAADIATVHQRIAKEAGLPASTLAQIASIWGETGMTPPVVTADTSLLEKPTNTDGFFEMTTTTTLPDSAVAQWGSAKVTSDNLGFVSSMLAPDRADAVWLKLNVENENTSTPMWILYSPSNDSMLTAYDASLKVVTAVNPELFKALHVLRSDFKDLFKWRINQFSDELQLLKGYGGIAGWFIKSKTLDPVQSTQVMNGVAVQVTSRTVVIRQRIAGFAVSWLLSRLIDPSIGAMLAMKQSVTFTSVNSSLVPNLLTPEVVSGERLIGVETLLTSGVVQKTALVSYDVNHPTLAPLGSTP